jgi:urease accessory protein
VRQANEVIPAGAWDQGTAVDSVTLDAHDRHRRRVRLIGTGGAAYLLNLAEPVQLHDGDGLVLDDGSIVLVAGLPEPLVEIAADDCHQLARLAWHLGNRHTDVQILGDRLRMRRDHVLEEMLRGLGARVTPVEAPFDPESGAYGHAPHGHDHGHLHDHDHHHHPDHDHDHGC